jgi:DNA invertase Pin-like site-specific DNA recombinase
MSGGTQLPRDASHGAKVRRGQERARARGVRIGRPPRIDATTRARARGMRAEGRSIREVALALGVSKSALARALQRPDAGQP